MWGVVWGLLNQIRDSEADQTRKVNACRVFSGSNSFFPFTGKAQGCRAAGAEAAWVKLPAPSRPQHVSSGSLSSVRPTKRGHSSAYPAGLLGCSHDLRGRPGLKNSWISMPHIVALLTREPEIQRQGGIC